LLVAPRTDPDGRSLAHPVLIADDWRRSELQDKDGARAVWEASAQPMRGHGSKRTAAGVGGEVHVATAQGSAPGTRPDCRGFQVPHSLLRIRWVLIERRIEAGVGVPRSSKIVSLQVKKVDNGSERRNIETWTQVSRIGRALPSKSTKSALAIHCVTPASMLCNWISLRKLEIPNPRRRHRICIFRGTCGCW
jgi:hypothetical protein